MNSNHSLGTPPSVEQIAQARKELGSCWDKAQDTPPLLVLPILNAALSFGRGLVDHLQHGEARDKLDDVPGALERDWHSAGARSYVDQVRAMGRPLVAGEVQALESIERKETKDGIWFLGEKGE